MSTRLILQPQDGGPSTELPRQGRLLIGSDPERADYVLEGSGIEALHCAIGRLKGGGWAIKDLGSRYGTSVNGKPASAARLSVGDVLVLGSRRLIIQDPAGGSAPQTKAPQSSPAAPPPKAPESAQKESSTAKPASSPSPRSAARHDPPSIPGYTVKRYLGRGASGTVWLARQESLAREVALKVLSPKLAQDADFVARFQAEARAAAALNHPNVVHVYDVGAANGFHYLCMEFMDDGCLETQLILNGPLPWREVLTIVSDAARGLSYAQTQGLVHRDIKPANLMRGSDGRTRLADLGLATSIEAVELDGVEDGQRKLVGTPQFLAPEVIRGEPASPASDLYSLGATAYRLLSGHTPFEAEKAADVLRAVLRDEPEALASRVPGLPFPVAGLVHRMLSKDGASRPATAKVVVDEIENIQDGRSSANLEGIGGKAPTQRGPMIALVLVIAAFLAWYFINLPGHPKADEPNGPQVSETQPKGPTTSDPSPNVPLTETPDPVTGPVITSNGNGEVPAGDDPTDHDPTDHDTAEQAFERKAQVALKALQAQTLTDSQRVQALRDLAMEWAGSSTSTDALASAEAIEANQGADQATEQKLSTRRVALLELLRTAATFDPAKPGLSGILARLEQVPGQLDFAQDLGFQQGKEAILDGLFDAALVRAAQVLSDAASQQASGEFTALPGLLRAFIEQADLPPESPQEDQRLFLLRQNIASAAAILRNLSNLEATFRTTRADSEQELVKDAITGTGAGDPGVLALLQAGDLVQADAALLSLLAIVQTPTLTTPLQTLQADIQAGLRALGFLSQSFTSPGWRRKTVLDLRRGQVSYDVISCDGQGPMVMVDGTLTHLGWAPFMVSAKGLDHLFDRRLERSYSGAEKVDISRLMRLAAVLESYNMAQDLMDQAVVTDQRLRKLNQPFEQAFAPGGEELPAQEATQLQLEMAAVRSLGLGLQDLSADNPMGASTHLERLATEYQASVFLLLLHTLPGDS